MLSNTIFNHILYTQVALNIFNNLTNLNLILSCTNLSIPRVHFSKVIFYVVDLKNRPTNTPSHPALVSDQTGSDVGLKPPRRSQVKFSCSKQSRTRSNIIVSLLLRANTDCTQNGEADGRAPPGQQVSTTVTERLCSA